MKDLRAFAIVALAALAGCGPETDRPERLPGEEIARGLAIFKEAVCRAKPLFGAERVERRRGASESARDVLL